MRRSAGPPPRRNGWLERARLEAEIERQRVVLRQASRWLDSTRVAAEALFQSLTWRSGRLLISTASDLFGRRGPTVREQLEGIFAEVATWQAGEPALRDDPSPVAAGAGVARPTAWAALRSERLQRLSVDVVLRVQRDADAARPCLEALRSRTGRSHGLYLVGERAGDLARHEPGAVVLADPGGSSGYAVDMNRGLAASRADYVVLMDDDVLVSWRWLERLLACGEEDPRIGLVAPVSASQAAPEALLASNGVDAQALLVALAAGETVVVSSPSGSCLAIKRAVMQAIGYLDERLAARDPADCEYAERAAEAGFLSALSTSTLVSANVARSTGGAERIALASRERLAAWSAGRWLEQRPGAWRVLFAPHGDASAALAQASLARSLGVDARVAVPVEQEPALRRGQPPLAGGLLQAYADSNHLADLASRAHLLVIPGPLSAALEDALDQHPGVAVTRDPLPLGASPDVLAWLAPLHGDSLRRRAPDRRVHVAILPSTGADGVPLASAHVRLLRPLQHPSVRGRVTLEVCRLDELFSTTAQVVIVQRTSLPDPVWAGRLLASCRARGARVVLELDDDLLRGDTKLDLTPLSSEELRALRMIAVGADLIVASSPALADYLRSLNPHVVCVPNALDEALWLGPGDAVRPRRQDGTTPVRVLYMGTRTHSRDLELVRGACAQLQRQLGARVVFETVGGVSRPDAAIGVALEPERHPGALDDYLGFVAWLRRQRRWDVGLAPLEDTTFNRSKSYLKFLDYSALGLAIICSDIAPYREVVRHGHNGLLVGAAPGAWLEAMRLLIEDAPRREALAEQAFQDLRARHLLAQVAGALVDACLTTPA